MENTNKDKKKQRDTIIYRIMLVLLVVVLIYGLTGNRIGSAMGLSMYPTYEYMDMSLETKIRDNTQINRFDVVGIDGSRFSAMVDTKDGLLKRIIALPGETVEISDNTIYINGTALEDPYGYYDESVQGDLPDVKYVLEDDQYFVMGDNRLNSFDSADFGPILRSELLYKSHHLGILSVALRPLGYISAGIKSIFN